MGEEISEAIERIPAGRFGRVRRFVKKRREEEAKKREERRMLLESARKTVRKELARKQARRQVRAALERKPIIPRLERKKILPLANIGGFTGFKTMTGISPTVNKKRKPLDIFI